MGVLASNGNRLLLGAWLTPTSLGLYSIASNLSSVIDGIGGRVFGSVSLPVLSEIVVEQPHRLREVFFRMRRGAGAPPTLAAPASCMPPGTPSWHCYTISDILRLGKCLSYYLLSSLRPIWARSRRLHRSWKAQLSDCNKCHQGGFTSRPASAHVLFIGHAGRYSGGGALLISYRSADA